MIVDAFTYAGEEHALRIRLNELADVADVHVIAEGNITFQGEERDAAFSARRVALWGFDEAKFDHQVFDLPRGNAAPFEREAALRNLMGEYVRFKYKYEMPTVLMSDADEIPRAEQVRHVKTPLWLPSERHFYWTLDWEFRGGIYGCAPVLLPPQVRCGQDYRSFRSSLEPSGWHFSFLCDPAAAQRKYRSFSHAELADVADRDLFEFYKKGLDPSPERGLSCVPVEIDDTWPRWVVENPDWVRQNRLARRYWA